VDFYVAKGTYYSTRISNQTPLTVTQLTAIFILSTLHHLTLYEVNVHQYSILLDFQKKKLPCVHRDSSNHINNTINFL